MNPSTPLFSVEREREWPPGRVGGGGRRWVQACWGVRAAAAADERR